MKPASSPQNPDIRKILKDMESLKAEYPPELLSARRAAFLDQVAQQAQRVSEEELSPRDLEIIDLLKRMKNLEEEYPAKFMAARRTAFVRQIAWRNWLNWWIALRSAIQKRFAFLANAQTVSTTRWQRTSFVIASLVVAAFIGFLSYGNRDRTPILSLAAEEIPQPVPVISITNTPVVEKIICRPGYEPPLCLAAEFRKSQDLTYQGNGSARPAVAKDTIPGFGVVHRASYINDGLYGPGASWVSNSKDSWIKIDLGKATTINTVTFGRDRLGKFNDRDPGQFVVAVALSDDVYANGNNSNDEMEYTSVYDSKQAGFKGSISGAETVMVQFDLQEARYIKITFENKGTAIDEVEVFIMEPPVLAGQPSKTPKEKPPVSTSTSTSRPTNTPLPSSTATLVPTDTTVPTDTATPLPTGTPVPSDTFTPDPTDTPVPTNTPVPTDTPEPTNTFIPTNPPEPTNTRVPTNTPIPEPIDPPPPTEPAVIEPTSLPPPIAWPPGLENNWPGPTKKPLGPKPFLE